MVDARERQRELVVREGDVREVRVDARQVLRLHVDVELPLVLVVHRSFTILELWKRPNTSSAVERLAARVGEVAGAEVELERPKDPAHGDFATNVALRSAKSIGRPPRELAAEIAAKVLELDDVDSSEVAGPGFLNLRLSDGFFLDALAEIGDGYGGGWVRRAGARSGGDGVREPDRADRRLGRPKRRLRRLRRAAARVRRA